MRTVYVRKEYEELFDSLPNKSEFMAWALELVKKKREKEDVRYTEPEPYA